MKAALDVLAQLPAPRIFVMGDIGELGEDESPAMHAEVGSYAREKGIERAYFVGDFSASAAEAFGEQGLWFADKDPLIQVLCHELPPQANPKAVLIHTLSSGLKHGNLIWCGVNNVPRCNYLWQGNTMCIMRLPLLLWHSAQV